MMQTTVSTTQNAFLISSTVWKDVPASLCLELPKIAEHLSKSIDIKTFGEGVDAILFVAIIVPSQYDDHRNDYRYSSKVRQIRIVQRLDYELIVGQSIDEFREYFTQAFVSSLKKLKLKKSLPSFDTTSLADAVSISLSLG
jgi:hypothetical protein